MRRNVNILLFDDVEVLDFAGPFEVFSVADKLEEGGVFDVRTVSVSASRAVRAVNGLKVEADHSLNDDLPPGVLVVPGGIGTRRLLEDQVLLAWIKAQVPRSELVASVCTGALLLAKAGLLDGLRVTTHHSALGLLGSLAPAAVIDPARRFHDTGKICTAAGISAGIDLSLHLVGRLHSRDLAMRVAGQMEYELRS